MKKAFLRILCLFLGLNVFTACYGVPTPPPDSTPDPELELTQNAAADGEEDAPEDEEGAEQVQQ